MTSAHRPIQRPPDAKLLVINSDRTMTHAPRSRFVDLLQPFDLVVANDAATLPASLHGMHVPTGAEIEVRLARRHSLDLDDVRGFWAVVFGAGDFHTRTEDRPLPPRLTPGDRLVVGSRLTGVDQLSATIEALLDHPRLVSLRFDGSSETVWAGLARFGRPIQYAHMPTPLAMWDVWTPIAAQPVAFEPPSASFALDWETIHAMGERGVAFATVTLAAGLSSTGDPILDRRLPFDEPYRIPEATASALRDVKSKGGRVVAIGTTVVRALEHAWRNGAVRAGEGMANQRITRTTRLQVVDAILSGTHEPDSSHYQLLRAFVDEDTLTDANLQLEALGYRTHEFGDSVFIEKDRRGSGSSRTLQEVLHDDLIASLPSILTCRVSRPHTRNPSDL
jgi:S-adenosylmethionine:tRNA ribosyltransferase-isomerase